MTSRHYLVTGVGGMLGRRVVERLESQGEAVTGVDMAQADLTRSSDVLSLFETIRPTHVLHCAAYTNVDKAESEIDICNLVNVNAPALLADACLRTGAVLQMVSTDFVFDGAKGAPYTPADRPNPLGVYGATKRNGEREVMARLERCQIVRTAWLFGPGKGNFVTAIYSRLVRGEPLRVVQDQVGSPTYTMDLARVMVDLINRDAWGIFHAVNAGHCSWFEFARAIAQISGHDPNRITPIKASEWPSPAQRPACSILDCSATYALGIAPMRPWAEALAEYIALLRSQDEAS